MLKMRFFQPTNLLSYTYFFYIAAISKLLTVNDKWLVMENNSSKLPIEYLFDLMFPEKNEHQQLEEKEKRNSLNRVVIENRNCTGL